MQRANLLLALAAASIAIATAAGLPPNFHHDESPAWTSFCVGNGGLHAESGVIAGCHSYGFFTDKIETTGWSYLHVESDHSLSDHDQAYAAGFAEGFLSSKRIQQSIANTFSSVFPRTNGSCPQEVYTWLTQQQQWIATQVAANPRDTFWTQVAFTYQQITGMSDGATAAGYKVSPLDLLVMNAAAEVGDIQLAINATLREELDVLNMHDFAKVQLTMARNSHCSALIRLAPDGSDLFSAHTTWTSYQQMLRTYKHYSVAPFGTRSKGVQFSSYPGAVSSIDDYYQTSSGLIVIETTNNVANMSLYDLVNYTSVLTFARAAVANRLAADGETWTQIFARENSGTYNNQWMVVDNKMFTPHQPPRANTLWILSQFPGGTRTLDATPVLTRIGFWPSYNIPYFPEVWTLLGYGELVKQYGANGAYLWNYSGSFRNLLFTRDAPHVSDLAGMQAIIQSNKWQTDPLSHGSAELAIAARMDLSSGPLGPGAQADGAIDAKLSSASFMRDAEFGTTGSMSVLAKSGPTVESQPPFTWSSSDFNAMLHEGQPDTFNFEWQKFAVVQRPNPTQRKDKAADKAPRAPVRIALE